MGDEHLLAVQEREVHAAVTLKPVDLNEMAKDLLLTTPSLAKDAIHRPLLPLFEYSGGGYYRLATVPRGESSPVLHGDEIMQAVMAALVFEQT